MADQYSHPTATRVAGMGLRNREAAEKAIRAFLQEFGYDTNSDALRDTPARVVRAWEELVSGEGRDAKDVLSRVFDSDGFDQAVILRDISFDSLCEHHLMPFTGKASIAYIPNENGKVVGLSKLARLVELHSRRLQLQERMTRGIANDMERYLTPAGVAVVVQASHTCMCGRGIRKPGALMVTSEMRGAFRSSDAARSEVMRLFGL
jgi:GTP cyclohydrolase IA